MFNSRNIAKDLLRRQHHQPSADESITHSSYDMIDPVEDDQVEETLDKLDTGSQPRKYFWTLRHRERPILDDETPSGGIEGRRVVSEPLLLGRKGGMSVLRRFKTGKGHQEVDERDVTISTETDVSVGVDAETEIMHGDETGADSPGPILPHPRHRNLEESFPSFISFPTSDTSSASSPNNRLQGSHIPHRPPPRQRQQARPRNPTPCTASSKSTTSQYTLPPLDSPYVTPILATAIRNVTLEARIPTHEGDISSSTADDSSNTSSPYNTTDGNVEYPSYLDSSSGIGGILRPRNTRAPPNTPTLTVHFDDTPRTKYLRRKALEKSSSAQTSLSLPEAKFNSGRRWARLSKIMNRLEGNHDMSEGEEADVSTDSAYASPTSFIEPIMPDTPGKPNASRSFSTSDSPISFARFDAPEPVSSTPLAKYRFPLPPNRYQSSRWTHSASTSSFSPDTSPSCLSGDMSARTRSFEEEGERDEVVEECSALEALLEYGSSSESEGDSKVAVYGESFMASPEGKRESSGARGQCEEWQAGAAAAGSSTGSGTASGAGSRRGSADLLPLKFKGLAVSVVEDPFPFAKRLRF